MACHRNIWRGLLLRIAIVSLLGIAIVSLWVYSREGGMQGHQPQRELPIALETNLRGDGKPPPLAPNNVTCPNVLRWLPPYATDSKLLVVQVVNEPYLKIQQNFMALMDKNSPATKDSLYLLCLDRKSITVMASMGVHCVQVDGIIANSGNKDAVWLIRMKVLECLLKDSRDVLMSDNDAVWLKDPVPELLKIEGDLLVQRAPWPPETGDPVFGVTMCMGFALFRSRGQGMTKFQSEVDRLLHETGDDQISVNRVAAALEPEFDYATSDMRYQASTAVGRCVLKGLEGTFTVGYLPHNKYTRDCDKTPVSDETIVAHCHTWGPVERRISTMKERGVWVLDK